MAEECIYYNMYYMRLFGFKASSMQRYFFLDKLYRAAVIRNNKPILEASTESESTIKIIAIAELRDLQTNNKPCDDAATGPAPRRSPRDGNQPNSVMLPDQFLLCKNVKVQTKQEDQRETSQCAGISHRRNGKTMCFSSCTTNKTLI